MFQNMAASPGLSPGYNNYNSYGGGHGHGHGGHGGHGHSHDDHSGEAGCDIELKYLAVFLVPFKIFKLFIHSPHAICLRQLTILSCRKPLLELSHFSLTSYIHIAGISA